MPFCSWRLLSFYFYISLPFSPNLRHLERALNILAMEMLKVRNNIRTRNTTQKCKFKLFLRNSSIYTSVK